MTNKDKFLKDGVSVEEFAKSIVARFFGDDCFSENDYLRIKNWAEDNYPTLTEDERVILRNIDGHTFEDIRRNQCGFLELYDECLNEWISCQFKDSLFQFIKERRRIRDKGVIKWKRRLNIQT